MSNDTNLPAESDNSDPLLKSELEPNPPADNEANVVSALSDASDDPALGEGKTGPLALLALGVDAEGSNALGEPALGWLLGPAEIDPYSGDEIEKESPDWSKDGGNAKSLTGDGSAANAANPYTGGKTVDPNTGDQQAAAANSTNGEQPPASDGSNGSASKSVDPTKIPLRPDQADRLIAGQRPVDTVTVDGVQYQVVNVSVNGIRTEVYYNDRLQSGWIQLAPPETGVLPGGEGAQGTKNAGASSPVPLASASRSDSPVVHESPGLNPPPSAEGDPASSSFWRSLSSSFYNGTTQAPFSDFTHVGPHDMFQPFHGVDTGSVIENYAINTVGGVSNLARIPFNILSNVVGGVEDFAKALGASSSEIEGANMYLAAMGPGEVELAAAGVEEIGTRLSGLVTGIRSAVETAFAEHEAGTIATVGSRSGELAANLWSLHPFERGKEIENVLARTEYSGWTHVGEFNNGFSPLVDFERGNEVVSLKTFDPTIKTFDNSMENLVDHLQDLSVAEIPSVGTDVQRILDVRVPSETPEEIIHAIQESLEYAIPEGLESIVGVRVSRF